MSSNEQFTPQPVSRMTKMPTLMAGDVPGRELMCFLRQRLCEKRMLRWGQIEDSELVGLAPASQHGSLGFAVQLKPDGRLAFTVAVSVPSVVCA